MLIKNTVRLLTFAVFFPAAGWAQTAMPQPLGAEVPPLTTGSEQAAKNVLELRLRVAGTFDDNALADNRNRHSDTEFDFQPTIDFRQELERMKWNMFYAPGFSANQHYSARRYFSQTAGSAFSYQLLKHLALNLHGKASLTTNPFDQLDRNASTPQSNLLDRPNTTVVLPKYKQVGVDGGIGLDWFTSPFTTLNLSGDISDLRYRSLPTQSFSQRRLIDTRIVHGHGGVLHRWTARQTVGALYDYQDLAFPLAHSRTVSHSVMGFDEFAIKPNMKLTLFGGPEYSRLHDIVEVNFLFFIFRRPTFRTMWSPTAVAEFSWQG